MDKTRPSREQNLVDWARSSLNDSRKLNRIMDSRLEGQYSAKGALKAAQLAYQCLRHNPKSRPLMSTVVETLEPLVDLKDDIPVAHFVYTVAPEDPVKKQVVGEEAAVKEGGQTPERQRQQRRRSAGQRPHPGRLPKSPNEKTVFSFTDSELYKDGAPVDGARHRGRGA